MIDALKYFLIEAREHLDGLSTGLLALEQAPDDEESVRELFRLAHTLKGAARMTGQDGIGQVAHKIEDLLGVIRDDGATVDEAVVSTMLDGVGAIGDMVTALSEGKTASGIDPEPVLARMDKTLAAMGPRSGKAAKKTAAGKKPPRKGTGNPPATKKITAKKPVPRKPDKPKTGREPDQDAATDHVTPDGPGQLPPAATSFRSKQEKAPEKSPSSRTDEQGMLRVALGKIDGIGNLAGELLIHQIRHTDQVRKFRALGQDTLRVIRAMGEIQGWARSAEVREQLGNTPAGEHLQQILSRGRTVSLKEGIKGMMTDIKSLSAQVEQSVSQLHEQVMDLRMLPADNLITPLRLVARETSKKLGRKVRLDVSGETIEIDKALLEGIREPLAHLLRNAIAHGIEDTAERAAAGKPEEGRIHLAFEREGSKLTIAVTDDGRGIDRERVRQAAVDHGVIDAGEPLPESGQELLRLLLKPGISTAAEVSEVAGRGVGLDVVSARVRELTGSISLSSTEGHGTEVRLNLPVNLSALDGFVFTSGYRTFAVPLESVMQVRQASEDPIHLVASQLALHLDGHTVPYATMERMLTGRDEPCAGPRVILRAAGERLALGVDRVVGVRTMIIKPLPAHVGELPWVSGITILASGHPVVILNVGQIFLAARDQSAPRQFPGTEPARAGEKPGTGTVLVVDDSLSVRMMVKGILEEAGYQVALAENGAEGLARVGAGGISLVISDVEMPHMDGLDLVRTIRDNPATRTLPVIMISSLNSDKDRRHGKHSGADLYLPKEKLNQETVLDAVTRLIKT